jgi:predicted RNA methylase
MAAVNSSSISLKRLKRDTDNSDHYFQAYSDLGVHEDMVRDFVRTNTYRKAIEEYSKYFKNKVVLDVGAGTCILSIFCAKAGARKVYAVEASDIVYQAKKVIEENSFQHVITTFHSKIEDIILPEKVDIIVSEWMGYFLLFENMLSSVIYARDHWLQEGGIILPGQAKIHVCAISADTLLEEKLNFWDSTAKLYGVKMSSLA